MFRVSRGVVVAIGNTNRGCNYSTGNTVSSLKPYERVADYYAGKSVFVTGATGFVGKVLIERLLFNCTDIETIYVLIRPKDGADTQKRLQTIFNVPLFSKLKQVKPDALKKVIPIEGDITLTQLGIRASDRQKLKEKVSVVFHSAATVRFVDPFQAMMNINLEGTRRMMDLSREMKDLERFVYISTAFSNAHRKIIDETIYPPPKKLEDVCQMVKDYGHDDKKVNKYVSDVVNTYTFSKGLCEELIRQHRNDLPSVIVRPSIVCPMHHEPLPGWVDSWVAATATFSNVARGLTPYAYGTDDVVCDLIPVDYVANLTILVGAKGDVGGEDIAVYNICSGSENPITWKEGSDLFLEKSKEDGFSKKNARQLEFSKSTFVVKFGSFLRQTVPCFFADIGLVLTGKTPRHLVDDTRASLLREILKPFTSTSWFMKSRNTQTLISTLDDHDKHQFPCDVNKINWNSYFTIFFNGVKEYLLRIK
ncbi:unnamed protein product [Leptosia nina]|uniref:Fatty acyl-CoA reductase n=1 Tax=Leptosia nina TaxID=320188 RepID=A0AAV1IV17_9NEOP